MEGPGGTGVAKAGMRKISMRRAMIIPLVMVVAAAIIAAITNVDASQITGIAIVITIIATSVVSARPRDATG
jgi:uncharacterized membrane protein YdbT with pleckstrin-like domain